MGAQSTTLLASANGYAVSSLFNLESGQTARWTVIGTLDATCVVRLERSDNGGQSWSTVQTITAGAINSAGTIEGKYRYRFRVTAGATAQTSSLAATVTDQIDNVSTTTNRDGEVILRLTDKGQFGARPFVPLTDAATITPDCTSADRFHLTFTAAVGVTRVIATPTGLPPAGSGQWFTLVLKFTNLAAGNGDVTYDSGYDFGPKSQSVTPQTNAGECYEIFALNPVSGKLDHIGTSV
jgi:hypothetical protein